MNDCRFFATGKCQPVSEAECEDCLEYEPEDEEDRKNLRGA